MANIAIKYAIYPNPAQATLCQKTFGCCRFVYNQMLTVQQERYKLGEKHLSKMDANKYCNQNLKAEYPFLTEVDKFALTNSIYHLSGAYDRFFKHLGKFPKHKSKRKSKKSYTTNLTNSNIVVGDDFIKLPKLGKVKAKIHRSSESGWKLKSATISQQSDGSYYCSVLYEYSYNIKAITLDKNNTIGLDYKSDGLYVDSNGNKPPLHKYYRQSQKKLAKLQRRLSRKVGAKKNEVKSNNYLKQQIKVNRLHCHIANQRKDYLHKKSTEIANQYDIVCVENLNMRAMSNKGFGNGKATMDNGYGMFLAMLEYKLENRGKRLVKVDKYFPSSQTCYACGAIHQEMKDLSKRYFQCECGYNNDRDINAALNIKREGLRILGLL